MSTESHAEPAGPPPHAPIQSVERAAQMLGLFLDGRADLDLNEITRRLGLSRATAHRYCMSLRAVGLLRYEHDTGLYGLGARTIELGTAALDGLPIVKIAAPYLDALVTAVDRTTVMTVWDGQAPVVVRVNDNTSHLVRIGVRIGARLPLFRSAQGSVYLALSPRVRNQFRGRPELQSLEDELECVRVHGVSVRSEVSQGMRAIGAPVFRRDVVVATIAIVGTEATIPADVNTEMVVELRNTAAMMSKQLDEER